MKNIQLILLTVFSVYASATTVPSNDSACHAITPPSIVNWLSPIGAYTTAGSTGDIYPACFIPTGTVNTVWFEFTPTMVQMDISVDGGSSGMIPQMALVEPNTNCSGTWTPVTCEQAASGQTSVSIVGFSVVPGQTYYLVVSGINGADGPFTLGMNNHPGPGPAPGNDQCTGAIAINPGQHIYGSTAGATSTNDIPIGNWTCNADLDNPVWYTFVATTPPQDVVFNVNWRTHQHGDMQFDVFAFIGNGSPCANVGGLQSWRSLVPADSVPYYLPCQQDSVGPGFEIIPSYQLVGGVSYYVLVDNFPSDTVDFDFTATGIAAPGSSAGISVLQAQNAHTPYPNPTSGIFTMEMYHMGAYNVSLFDILGNKLRDMDMIGSVGQMDITPLPAGIYTLVIREDKLPARTFKVLKN